MKKREGKVINILFCGTGGQGVLAAAEVCAQAAMLEGYHVKKSEVHGMAQRGGSVESHLRFGGCVYSPLIPKGRSDYLVGFNRQEAIRLKDFLDKRSGVDFIGVMDNYKGEKRYLNTFLLGALSVHLPISVDNWFSAVSAVFSDKSLKENKEAFLKGREVAK